MKPKMMLKMGLDLVMTVLLLCQMAYMLIGEAAHEWMGAAMFVLFLLHHVLNWRLVPGIWLRENTPPCEFCKRLWIFWCCSP